MIQFRHWLIAAALVAGIVAQSDAQVIRYDARSAKGKEMLKIYAKAVGIMRNTAASDPNSWTFQWYTHAVRGDKTKPAALMDVFGANPSANKMLAETMWDTCQPHRAPNSEEDFLPWHRMYVFYFEQIIRDVSGEQSFTLPYWDYSVAGNDHGVIPPEFTMKDDPLFKSLYVENRNEGVNKGKPIDQNAPGALSTDVLDECFYESTEGINQGFCAKLDVGLHGNVHGLVGNAKNMGSVPWAAADPIFYLHHSNIDRLWASWNKAGRKNPMGMGSFTFASKKMAIVAKVADWMDPKTESHGYRYDNLEPVPDCLMTKEALSARLQNMVRVAAVKAMQVKLLNGPTRVNLEPIAKEGKPATPFHERVKGLPNNKKLVLLLKNLTASAAPGVVYQVYLELPEGAKGEKLIPHLVGTINFFDAVGHGNGNDKMKPPERFYSFDITKLSQALRANNQLTGSPVVTIVPVGSAEENSMPMIGEIYVVEH